MKMKDLAYGLMLTIAGQIPAIALAHDGNGMTSYYPTYPAYVQRDGGFDNADAYGDARGRGAGRASGEGEFSMSFSGKAKGEQLREGSFGSSSYGGSGDR